MANLIFGLFLFFVPFYFTYKFRKEKFYEKINFFFSIILLFFMAYLSYKGFEKIFYFFNWSDLNGLYAMSFFLFGGHVFVLNIDDHRSEWDPNNGNS